MLTDSDITHLCKRKGKLAAERGVWEDHWQDVTTYTLPNAADFNVKRSKGDRRTQLVYDSTGIHSAEMLAAGLHGMLTNPASEWFSIRVRTSDENLSEDAENKQYLDDTGNAMLAELSAPDVAFASHIHEYYLSLVTVGTGVLFVSEKAQQEGRLLFKSINIDEVMIAENSDGIIDTVYRTFKMTLRQIIQKWGEDALSDKMKMMLDKNDVDKEIEILHCVYPRTDVRKGREDKEGLPIASVYIVEKEKHLLSEGGFHEMPYMVARWSKATGETFGRSPAMTCLPDIKMLQEMMKTTIKAAQKIVDPPLLVPDDGVIGPIRTIPGGLNYYRASTGRMIEPLQTGGNPGIGMDMMEDVRNRIRMTFYLDQLQFQNGPQMTATEVMERTERTLRLLGPTLGRLQSEFLGPMIERIFGVLFRAGRLPVPPESLEGQELKIEYVSPIARAQRQIEIQGMMRTIEMALTAAQVDPEAAMVIKGGDMVRETSNLLGVSPSMIKTPKELAEQIRMQQQMQQQQMMLQAADQAAGVAEKASKAGII